MLETLPDEHWEELLDFIQDENCTPFVGAGACVPNLPLGSELASQWALDFQYPLPDSSDLPRVAQFLAVERYPMFPKDRIKKLLEERIAENPPNFFEPDEPHGVLADLKLPIYITTNYDCCMVRAIESRERSPRREACRWFQTDEENGFASTSREAPTPASPLVYHLHGHCDEPQSMVLTEGDYLDFLIRLSNEHRDRFLPPEVRRAITGKSLLFVGYSLADVSFRVLFRGLTKTLEGDARYPSIAVQLPPGNLDAARLDQARGYLDRYMGAIQRAKVRVFWGDARTFAGELRSRWEARERASR